MHQNRDSMSPLQSYWHLCLKKACKTTKGGSPMPFVDHTMLAHETWFRRIHEHVSINVACDDNLFY
jgi:hypothetical protein